MFSLKLRIQDFVDLDIPMIEIWNDKEWRLQILDKDPLSYL